MFLELLSIETNGGKHIPVYQDFKAVKPWVRDQLSFRFSSWHISHSITAKSGCDTKPDAQLISIYYLQINNTDKTKLLSLIHKAWNHHVSNLYQKPADLTFIKQDAHLGCLFAPPFLLQTGTLMSHVFFQRYTARFGKTICVFPCDLLRVLVLTEPQTTQNALEPKFIPLARIPNSPSRATALKFPRHHSVLPKEHWNK